MGGQRTIVCVSLLCCAIAEVQCMQDGVVPARVAAVIFSDEGPFVCYVGQKCFLFCGGYYYG